jgi:hypothetical protein
MNTVERQFPTEEEVDQWIETHTINNADTDGNPELDQLKAASKEVASRLATSGPAMVASGLVDTFFGGEKPERSSRSSASCLLRLTA